MKGVNQGLSSLKSLATERERLRARTSIRYYFQLFFQLEQRKTHAHTREPDTVFLKFVAGRKVLAYIEGKF